MPLDIAENILFMRVRATRAGNGIERFPQRCPHVWKAPSDLARGGRLVMGQFEFGPGRRSALVLRLRGA